MIYHCTNNCIIRHEDEDLLTRLEEGLIKFEPEFLSMFVPCPENEQCTTYWGTETDAYCVEILFKSATLIHFKFYTQDRPPIAGYEKLRQLGFHTIDAMFMEGGNDFCGYWVNGQYKMFENASENVDTLPPSFRSHYVLPADEAQEAEQVEEEDIQPVRGSLL